LSKNLYGNITKLWRIRYRHIIATLYLSMIIYLWVLQIIMINIIYAAVNIDPSHSINNIVVHFTPFLKDFFSSVLVFRAGNENADS
jgi:hypothetical protein